MHADLYELSDRDWEAHITGGVSPRLVTTDDLRLNAPTVAPPVFATVLEGRFRTDVN